MELRDFFTGGPEVQHARNTVRELGEKTNLSNRNKRQLTEARRVTRRHAIGLGLKAGSLIGATALTGGLLLNKDNETSIDREGEFSHELVLQIASRSIEDYNRIFGLNLDVNEILPKIESVDTIQKFTEIYNQVNPSPNNSSPIEDLHKLLAITSNEYSSLGEKIYFNKETIEEYVSSLKNSLPESVKRSEILEMLLKHELVHYAPKSYRSDELHSAIYVRLLKDNPELAGKVTIPGLVHGAKITATSPSRAGIMNPYNTVEEAESIFISMIAMKERGRDLIVPPLDGRLYGIPVQYGLFRELMTRIDPNPVEAARLLMDQRMKEGGREEFFRLIARSNPNAHVRESDELTYAGMILLQVETGNIDKFNSLVNPVFSK